MSRTTSPPRVVSAADDSFALTARQLLADMDSRTVLSRLQGPELLKRLEEVAAIFTDVDGTIVEEGHTALGRDYIQLITALAAKGVSTTLVTGKPLQEIKKLIDSIPAHASLSVVYEKGAYCLRPDDQGVLVKQYLLSTPELEASMHDLRNALVVEQHAIEEKYIDANGQPLISLGWAGSGTHESVLSIDILQGNAPGNYLDFVGSQREELKITDATLLGRVETDLRAFTERHRPGWQVVHLGNGNIEIAPGPVEKDAAIKVLPMFAAAHGVLVLGDSGNDRKMLALRADEKVLAGVVLHRQQSLGLTDGADLVAFGMANARVFLELLLAARAHQL